MKKRKIMLEDNKKLLVVSLIAFVMIIIYIFIKMYYNGFPNAQGPLVRSGVDKSIICDNDITSIHQTEDQYYSNPDNSNFTFTIEVQATESCNNTSKSYFVGEDYTIYLYCLEDILIHFENEVVSLDDAIEANKITMRDITNIIPRQIHKGDNDGYLLSDKYGLANSNLAIYYDSEKQYFIGPLTMCDNENFDEVE